jgi:hypothetical protein
MDKAQYQKTYQAIYKKTPQFKINRQAHLKRWICECGGRVDSDHVNRHLDSKKHQRFLMNMDMVDFIPPPFESVCFSDFECDAPFSVTDSDDVDMSFLDDLDMTAFSDDDDDVELNHDSNSI